jgi:glycosyltransferase involved in cell wall biosynthesis
LKSYVSDKGLDNYVTFAGFRKDVPRILASGDIFLLTSKEEGLGTSLLDAFLAQIPVVATDAGGIPEIVRHMDTGLLAPVKDSEKLAEHVKLLIADEFLRGLVVKQAHDFVQYFSKSRMASKTLDVYRNVTKKTVLV